MLLQRLSTNNLDLFEFSAVAHTDDVPGKIVEYILHLGVSRLEKLQGRER